MSPVLVFMLAVLAALSLSFLCSICEATLLGVPRAEIEALCKRGARAGQVLRGFKQNIDRPLGAILILDTVALTMGAVVAGSTYAEAFHPRSLWIFVLGFPAAMVVLGELAPRAIGVSYARRLAVPVSQVVRGLIWLLRPALWLTTALGRAFTHGQERLPGTSIEEIRLLARLGRLDGSFSPRVAQVIEGAASLRELTVRDVMVPRNGVAFLSGALSLEENLAVIRTSRHSRFPFTPTGAIDDVDGVVLAKELLFRIHEQGGEVSWPALTTPLLVVPETTPLERVLRSFQEQRNHLAVAVDEYGGTQGVVTLEDVLEELVGEIEDETDRIEQLMVKRPDGSLVCRGWAETRKVFKVLGIDEKTELVTLSGYLADLLGRIPQVGDAVVRAGYRFRVVKASARRAERIEVVRAPD